MMIAPSALRRILLVLPMLALAACNVVGEGSKIETLQIKDAVYGYDIAQPLQTFRCLRYNLASLGTFTDGSSAFYTDRTVWSSNNTSVVRVSNGDIALPSDATLVYSKGTVIPVGAGTATITADYVGVKATLQVTVSGTVPTITIVPTTTFTPRPSAPAQPITIAPRTIQTYTALASLNGRSTDITNVGVWSVQNANTATDAIAKFTSGSSFKGVGAGGPLTIQADFNQVVGACAAPVTTALQVAALQSIALSSEYGSSPSPLVVSTTDRLKAIATLAGGATQDISELTQTGDGTTGATIYNIPTITGTSTADFTVLSYAFNNLLRAVSTGATTQTNSADLTAKFVTTPATTSTSEVNITSNTLNRVTQDGTLAAITICAVGASTPVNSCSNPGSTTMKVPNYLQYGEDEARVPLRAIATFNLAAGGTVDQDVTRSVNWISSNSSIISILGGGSSPYQAGLAGSIKAGTVTVSASWSKGNVNTVTSNTLTLVAQ